MTLKRGCRIPVEQTEAGYTTHIPQGKIHTMKQHAQQNQYRRINVAANTLVTTRYLKGFVPLTSIASICSVTFIDPSSAPILEPIFPANQCSNYGLFP
jgi:hypothetical protein